MKGLTQEELSKILFVSRTAISKWESGRGYPSIDSLKSISKFFGVTIDDLLSTKELQSLIKIQKTKDLIFGFLDLLYFFMIFIPLFGEREGGFIKQVSLFQIENLNIYIKIVFIILILLTGIFGILLLGFRNFRNEIWTKNKNKISILISLINILFFILTRQAYVSIFSFALLAIKGFLILKPQ